MDLTDDGGPAFPVLQRDPWDKIHVACAGMSLRDWFAGLAILGGMTNGVPVDPQQISRAAYRLADAMIAARKVS